MTTQPKALAFTYDDRANEYRATYRGVTVRAVTDTDAENPFTSWDGNPPTLVYAGRRDGFTEYGDGLETPFAAMSDYQISRNWRAICAALGDSEKTHSEEVSEALADQRQNKRNGYTSGVSTAAIRRDIFKDRLSDASQGNGTDYLETLATLWRLAGCVAETWSSQGYSQGDWAEGLSVATPDWAKETGAPESSHQKQCEYAGKLYGFWAWGDVYGYVIGDDDIGGDSCWGFYGDDFAESGLEEGARNAVDCLLDSRAKRRQAKAAELIRARVPLALRPAILDAAEAEFGMNGEPTPLTPKMALAMILGALWRCALILIAFAAFVLAAPGLWPNK